MIRSKSALAFAAMILFLIGGNLFLSLMSLPSLIRFMRSYSAPQAHYVAASLWLVMLAAAILCAVVGLYLFFQRGKINNLYLWSYVGIVIPKFGFSQILFTVLPLSLDVWFKWNGFVLGVNFIGVGLLVWYRILVTKAKSEVAPSP